MDILTFPAPDRQPASAAPVNPHQPPGWQRAQTAAILALAAAEDKLANIGIRREEARIVSRDVVRTFLQQMAMSGAPLAPVTRVHDVVEDFLTVCERAHAQNAPHTNGAA
jgi:hypothetical protein